jgi:hypothetical protein
MRSPSGTLPFTQSDDGDLLPISSSGAFRSFAVDLFFEGPPNGTWILTLGYGFFDQVISGTSGAARSTGSGRASSMRSGCTRVE